MSIKLRELIRNIRACKTAADERAVIAKECALIRTAFKEEDTQYRHRNVAKLLFIHMLGYPTHFGQIECLKLIASARFAEKRVGYLGLTQLLDENTEVLMLVTNSIKNDLRHPNQYVNGLALCALANIANSEMCRALSREVEELIEVSNPYIRKKAALCGLRMIRKCEEIEEKFNHCVPSLLEDRNHGVVLAGIAFVQALLDNRKDLVESFRKYAPVLIRRLRTVLLSGYSSAAEYDVSGISDPFLQTKLLRLLRSLAQSSGSAHSSFSEELNDVLAQVATNTEGTKNAGNAILYECVRTIISIEGESSLRVMGINILGRFLQNKDNNIRYVALATLQHVVRIDVKAVQRHRSTIVECLKDADVSIRKRGLDVAFALISEENIKTMTKELLNYLLVADIEFKEDLVTKICLAVDRYSPSRRWHIDTLTKVMCLAGNFVRDEVRDSFVHVVMTTPELHSYSVHKLFFSVRENITQEALVLVGVWCIGEFADLLVSGETNGPDDQPIKVSPSEVIDLLEQIQRRPRDKSSTSSVVEFLITCLVKLTTRIPSEVPRIRKLLKRYEKSLSLEIQQRACEFEGLLGSAWDSYRDGVLDRMPVSDRIRQETQGANKPIGEANVDDVLARPGQPKDGTPQNLLDMDSLLDLNVAPVPAAPVVTGVLSDSIMGGGGGDPASKVSGTQLLEELFGGLSVDTPSTAPPAPVPASSPDAGGTLLDILDSSAPATIEAPNPLSPQQPGLADLGLLGDVGSPVPAASPSGVNQLGKISVYKANDLEVMLDFSRPFDEPSKTSILATFTNFGSTPVSDFNMECAVPKYSSMNLVPATSTSIPPNAINPASQIIHVINSQAGISPFGMKLRISFVRTGQKVTEMLVVSNLPEGV